jgi:hypothetical protein
LYYTNIGNTAKVEDDTYTMTYFQFCQFLHDSQIPDHKVTIGILIFDIIAEFDRHY